MIARADGTPVYHLAVVVDDHDAGITHVVRGADHYSNTPKHVLIQQAMGAETPRLRAPAAAARAGRQEALQAPRRRLGAGAARRAATCPRRCATTSRCSAGATTTRRRSSPPRSCSSDFTLERVSKSPAVFDEQKLRWMNGRYLRELRARRPDRAAGGAAPAAAGCATPSAITQEKISTLDEFWPLAGSFFDGPADDPAAREKFLAPGGGARGARRRPRGARRRCRSRGPPRASRRRCAARVERSGLKAKQVFQPLRVALDRDDRLTRGSSRPSRCSGATRRWRGSTPRSTAAAADSHVSGGGSTVRPRAADRG